MLHWYCILLLSVFLFCLSNGEKLEKLETECSINGQRVLQRVSEKFLSISIDPAVLVAGLNLSDSSLLLSKQLSPAYIRIAGPSTKFVRYVDNEDRYDDRLSTNGNNVVVTPSMWFGINEWLSLANLTPVFGINDAETARGVWNPKSTLPLLEISDKLNVSCYWQLGFDSSKKSEVQYEQDLNILSHIIDAFPERNGNWNIVGSDISTLPKEHTENVMEELKDIVSAVMWEPRDVTDDSFPEKDMSWKILHQKHKPDVKIWTTVPTSSDPTSFSSSLLWAKQVGDAAKFGYDVVFREPKMQEFFSDTPTYWFSLLHKKIMGNKVLDVKPTTYYTGSAVYAHCTRNGDDFESQGALTVMIVNSNLHKYKAKVSLGTTPAGKRMEVLSYILTSSAGNSTDIFLNGLQLTPDLLSEKTSFEPKRRKTKSKSYVSLEVPPQSIGFFVLPDAGLSVCINDENHIKQNSKQGTKISQSISSEEKTRSAEEAALDLASRGLFHNSPTLKKITQKMKNEVQFDENIYSRVKSGHDEMEQSARSDSAEEDQINSNNKKFLLKEKSKLTLRQKKPLDLGKRREELKLLLEKPQVAETNKPEPTMQTKPTNLELTSGEIEKILKDRAKARAAQRNIIFTDEELDALLQKASKQFLKSRTRSFTTVENRRKKRDINMQLLKKRLNLDSNSKDASENKQFHGINDDNFSLKMYGRSHRTPRDLNTKLLDIKSKIADRKQRIEDKRYEIIGNTQTLKDNIKDRIKNIKKWNRYRRDINMDLLKIKTEGQMKSTQKEAYKKPTKSLFKNRQQMEATMRKPGQTSDELLEELEEREIIPAEERKVVTKIDVYAELARSDNNDSDNEDGDDEEDVQYFNKNTKPKKSGIFGKKTLDPFAIVNPSTEKPKKRKTKKPKNALDENMQFLTTSEEFTDIQEDLPCIHEYFGSNLKNSKSMKNQKGFPELGETYALERNIKKWKNGKKKTTELDEVLLSSEDPFEELRLKRHTESVKSFGKVYSDASKVGKSRNDIKLTTQQEGPHLGTDSKFKVENSSQNKVENKRESNGEIKAVPEKLEKDVHGEHNPKAKRDFEADSHILRKKRNIDEKIVTRGDIKADDKGIKQHLEHLTELMSKLEQEKYKRNLKLAHIKKNVDDGTLTKRKDILKEIQQLEKGKTGEIITQLETLKKELAQKKKAIDINLLKDKKRQETETNEKQSIKNDEKFNLKTKEPKTFVLDKENFDINKNMKKKLAMDITKISKPEYKSKYMKRKPKYEQNLGESETVAQNITPNENVEPKDQIDKELPNQGNRNKIPESEQTVPEIRVSKRSVFDTNGFGSYRPLTPKLKSWKPSDILSLKRDTRLVNSQNLKPTNDYLGYTNIFGQNRYPSFRNRRGISTNTIDPENDVDDVMNDIEKQSDFTRPILLNPTTNSLYNSNSDETGEGAKSNKKTIETVKDGNLTHELTTKKTIEMVKPTVDPIIYYTFSDDCGKCTESDMNTTTESISTTTPSELSQEIAEKSHVIFRNLVSSVAEFFRNVGSRLGQYVKDFTSG